MKELKQHIRTGGWFNVVDALISGGVVPRTAHRVLLYGPPGTGKTTCPFKLLKDVEAVTLHQQFPPDDLIGSMGLVEKNGATVTQWQDGPAIRAMRRGGCLLINEISKRSPEVESALYNVLDDLEICSVTLPTGEVVKPAEGFVVFATMNDEPTCLPEAIQERFDIVLLCNRPAPGILNNLPAGPANLVKRHYDGLAQSVQPWTPSINVRSITGAVRMSTVVDMETAFQIKFGNKGTDVLAKAATTV